MTAPRRALATLARAAAVARGAIAGASALLSSLEASSAVTLSSRDWMAAALLRRVHRQVRYLSIGRQSEGQLPCCDVRAVSHLSVVQDLRDIAGDRSFKHVYLCSRRRLSPVAKASAKELSASYSARGSIPAVSAVEYHSVRTPAIRRFRKARPAPRLRSWKARARPAPGPRQGFFSDVTQFGLTDFAGQDLRTMEPVAGEIGHCFVVGARHQLRAWRARYRSLHVGVEFVTGHVCFFPTYFGFRFGTSASEKVCQTYHPPNHADYHEGHECQEHVHPTCTPTC